MEKSPLDHPIECPLVRNWITRAEKATQRIPADEPTDLSTAQDVYGELQGIRFSLHYGDYCPGSMMDEIIEAHRNAAGLIKPGENAQLRQIQRNILHYAQKILRLVWESQMQSVRKAA